MKGISIHVSPGFENEEHIRQTWGGKLEFLLTTIGYAIGLGNIWRFPYKVFESGGGAFLIPYFISMAVIGFPMFFFELSLGQFSSMGPFKLWAILPALKGIGYSMVAFSITLCWYYNIIITWSMYYFYQSFTFTLPYADCGHKWNDLKCTNYTEYMNIKETSVEDLQDILERKGVTNLSDLQTSCEQYFYRGVLQRSTGIDDIGTPVVHLVICSAITWFVIFLVLSKGIETLGKVTYVVSTLPYVVMTIMLVVGARLEGARKGIEFYLNPVWSKLQDPTVWTGAVTQAFFQLCVASGGLIVMSSYNRFSHNCQRDSYIVPVVSALTSIYAGFGVFSVLGFMSVTKNVEIGDIDAAGPSLVFIVYPEAISQMDYSYVWSVLFFLMLLLLGFSSIFALMESVFSPILDEFPTVRDNKLYNIACRFIGCVIMYCLSLILHFQNGYYTLTMVDQFCSSFPLLIIGFLEFTAVMWIYGVNNYSEDVRLMLGQPPNKLIKVLWAVVIPCALLGLIIFSCFGSKDVLSIKDYVYPADSYWLGWGVIYETLIWIPLVFLATILLNKGPIRKVFKATSSWAPALAKHREGTKYDHNPKTLSTCPSNGVHSSRDAILPNGDNEFMASTRF